MKFKEWNEIAELVGIAAVVGSLIFVGLQMKQAQEIGNAERRMTRVANQIELQNAINEHADIWVKGLSGQELGETETVRFENLVLTKSSYHQHLSGAAQNLGSDYGEQVQVRELALFLYANPSARVVWLSKQEQTRKADPLLVTAIRPSLHFADQVQSALATLDEVQY
ncbi:MAG: hypothetical protein OEU36_24890 [Gammaproteobacteria bacterium]|nr:hypothetical protein [Gammaproteobacteria bacterium]